MADFNKKLLWWKVVVAVVVLAVPLIWILATRKAEDTFSPGPLSIPHARLACADCHVSPFTDPNHNRAMEAACANCHPGMVHQKNEIASLTPGCLSCHKEHRSVPRINTTKDAQCVVCHANLRTTDGQMAFEPHITTWTLDHPDFKILKHGKDQTKIKFNHAIHVKGVFDANRKTVIPNCKDCHTTDDGKYMKAVSFDKHCKSCHDGNTGFDGVKVPHGKQPDFVLTFLRMHYEGKKEPKKEEDGRGFLFSKPPAEEQWVEERVSRAKNALFVSSAGCKYCHEMEGDKKIVPPAMPERWYHHSKFNHFIHRFSDCAECHAQANTSEKTSDLILPGINNCKKCHGQSEEKTWPFKASGDCHLCHKYHTSKGR